LELIGLAGIEDKYPAQLSGGQQQRVALARALATSPGLLLLDEPLSALDARVREHLRREIRSLQQRLGITTILVTHDQDEALTMADRIVVMNHGVIEQIGTPEEIYGYPQSRFVADFVGKSNWIPAKVAGKQSLAIGEATLQALHLPPMPAGERVDLFIRPEAVRLHSAWDAGLLREPNTALAAVSKIELLGGFYRVNLQVPLWGGLALMADINRDQMALLKLSVEQRIPVSLPHDQLRVFVSEAAQ
ncbi:MAG: ATP-binding cassette domain-containing protein, partial [Iodobacter sp.]